jgi:hypothetical protein
MLCGRIFKITLCYVVSTNTKNLECFDVVVYCIMCLWMHVYSTCSSYDSQCTTWCVHLMCKRFSYDFDAAYCHMLLTVECDCYFIDLLWLALDVIGG